MFDCAIIGGGVVGLASAMMLGRRHPDWKIVVVEKEPELAAHQSGRNSGVIHSGIYYKVGSSKAKFAVSGNRMLIEFCRLHGIAHEECGKIIVATQADELPRLRSLQERGVANGIRVDWLSREQVNEFEPHVRCQAAIRVPSTGIVDYREVCLKYAAQIEQAGGLLKMGASVEGFRRFGSVQILETTRGRIETKFLINCGGLHSDRLARKAGLAMPAKIIPFRGEYFELVPAKRHLVKSLIYPVPNLAFPFLGIHFTRMIDGAVHAGPSAVLAFKREGYEKTDVDLADLLETLRFGGFWKLARAHLKEGMLEMYRSVSKQAFVKKLQEMIPEVSESDLISSRAGVRAQALMPDGKLVDDFLIVRSERAIHVCNAPSPAATASLEIGRRVADMVSAGTAVRMPGLV